MTKIEASWLEGETLLSTVGEESVSAGVTVPALTILAHSDPSRVGERLTLPALKAGLEVRLSRVEPVFALPGQFRARALEERYLSRSPLFLRPGGEVGGVLLDCSTTRTSVVANGQPVVDSREFSGIELQDGVVLMLGSRVLLLLHLLPEPLWVEAPGFGLLGESLAVMDLRREIRRLAKLTVPVLLCGETGTGKELTARALHDEGARSGHPFVVVNMAALPPSLAAAELFGAVRGAYTGAGQTKKGLFQSAQGGTLFLDEIGETPTEIQPMLLRALESLEIRPVGSSGTLNIDVRVVAATDADLQSAIAAGSFRAPLFHRLAGYTVELPPLRHRRDDIGRLFAEFLEEELRRHDPEATGGVADPSLLIGLIARLAQHPWPGNVRELRNVVRRLVVIGLDAAPGVLNAHLDNLLGAPGGALEPPVTSISPKSPSPSFAPKARGPKPRRLLRKCSDVSQEELLAALESHRFKLQPVADTLGLSRINLYRLIESCPAVGKAADLEEPEIQDALIHCDGDLEGAAMRLRVSLQGLKRRMTKLGLPWMIS